MSRETNPTDAAVISVTNLTAGSGAVNVISGDAQLTGTVRTFRQEIRDNIKARMQVMTQSVASTFGVQSDFRYTKIVDQVINHPESTAYCRAAATEIVGEKNVRDFEPIMGGEDFGGFLQERPGAFMAIGQAEPDTGSPHSAGLHSPQYDFNDAILPMAATYFAELAERRLPIGEDS